MEMDPDLILLDKTVFSKIKSGLRGNFFLSKPCLDTLVLEGTCNDVDAELLQYTPPTHPEGGGSCSACPGDIYSDGAAITGSGQYMCSAATRGHVDSRTAQILMNTTNAKGGGYVLRFGVVWLGAG
jgi:hypothetical protein